MDRCAPAGKPFAIERQDTEHAAVVFRNVDDVIVVDVEEGRSDQLGRPDAEQFTLQVEDLNAIVLAVGYQQAAAPVIPDAMRHVELSWSLARLPQENWYLPSAANLCTRALP